MKRQMVLGFTGALMLGAFSLLGACNKHSFEDGEFDKGVKRLYEKHHSGGEGEGHGDEHGKGNGDSHAEHGKDAKHHDERAGLHSKEVKDTAAHKEEAAKKPAKSLFPKK